MSCSPFFEAILKACPATIVLDAGLTPAIEYFWLITSTRTNKVYQRKASADNAGKLNIDCSQLPAGLLNQHAGAFELQIREGNNYLTVKKLTIETVQYDGVLMWFQEVKGDTGVNNQIPANA